MSPTNKIISRNGKHLYQVYALNYLVPRNDEHCSFLKKINTSFFFKLSPPILSLVDNLISLKKRTINSMDGKRRENLRISQQ